MRNFVLSVCFAFSIIGSCLLVRADLPTMFAVKLSFELKNGSKVSGFFPAGAYGGCRYSKERKQYLTQNPSSSGEAEIELGKYLMGNIRDLWSSEVLDIYRNIYKLNYLPVNKKKRHCGEGEYANDCQSTGRISFVGVLKSEGTQVKASSIKNIKVESCQDFPGEVAPTVELQNNTELELLKTPAKAFYTVEHFPEGNVSLISYNDKFDTPEKLKLLLKDFLKNNLSEKLYKSGESCPWNDEKHAEECWWDGIYSREKEFKKKYSQQNIILLIYHVTD